MTEQTMATQNAEFDAARELAKQMRRIELTPIVDDDYPAVRHGYEGAVRAFIEACYNNGRLKLNAIDAEAKEKLAAYEEQAHRRERLGQIVAFLFPRYNARQNERPASLYPDCYWWNGASIDENTVELGSAGQSVECSVKSYVGGGETDVKEISIPVAWMEAEDFKPLVLAWVAAEGDRLKREKTARERARAEEDLKRAQERLKRLSESGT